MKTSRLKLLVAALLLPAAHGVNAASLVADAMVCESEADLQFVEDNKRMAGQPATVALKEASSMAKFMELKQEAARIAPQVTSRREAEEAAKTEVQYRRIQTVCASGGAAQAVTVVERKPISGVAKVDMSFRGARVQLWTQARNLSEP